MDKFPFAEYPPWNTPKAEVIVNARSLAINMPQFKTNRKENLIIWQSS